MPQTEIEYYILYLLVKVLRPHTPRNGLPLISEKIQFNEDDIIWPDILDLPPTQAKLNEGLVPGFAY